jgi:protein gp37
MFLANRVLKKETYDSTNIGWTWEIRPDGTYVRGYSFNAWMGCTKHGPECLFCYADTIMDQKGRDLFGKHTRRHFVSDGAWKKLRTWNRRAEKLGYHAKVFCSSFSDVFEELCESHPDIEAMEKARARLFAEMEACTHLTFIICTKRPMNALRMVPPKWSDGFPENVWVLATTGTQRTADRLIPRLLEIPATVIGLSVEPMLEPLKLPQEFLDRGGRSWVICGGESGKQAGIRAAHSDWYRDLRDQCVDADVPFFFKQVGDWIHEPLIVNPTKVQQTRLSKAKADPARVKAWEDDSRSYRLHKKSNGRLLDGREWNQFPGVCF